MRVCVCVHFVLVCVGEKTHVTFSEEVVNHDTALLGHSWIIDNSVAGGARWQQAC